MFIRVSSVVERLTGQTMIAQDPKVHQIKQSLDDTRFVVVRQFIEQSISISSSGRS
jgi:hypothetical protein